MDPTKESDLLKERIKELTCLYEISSLSAVDKPFQEILQSIVLTIPHAWRFPEDAICEVTLKEFHLWSSEKTAPTIYQECPISIDGTTIGNLKIHYPASTHAIEDFLLEEKKLLKKLSLEIATILERKESKERENEYLQKFRREDRLRILEEITAGIAHELNTPLSNIFGFAQFIIESERNAQTLSDAQKILNSAIHAREIVKKLMYFSCELPQRFEYTSINKLTEDALRLLEPTFQKSNIRLVFSKDAQETQVQLDTIQITQVLFNLLNNAVQASEKNTTISVAIETVEDQIILCISDEGKGIPTKDLEKIFEPFYSTKEVGEGSGLGLSVVHGIIRQHKGTINVISELGKGTIFTITLPISQKL